MSRRERREFTDEFKIQMVNLYNNGKPRSEIIPHLPSMLG